MELVEGNYCPILRHRCLQHAKDYEKAVEKRAERRAKGKKVGPMTVPERCLRYAENVRCLAKKRRPMRFCMDRYEWPNEVGKLPSFLVSWKEAKAACEGVGKRLCTADEFNFACEGEKLLPYSYGHVRDPNHCNIDKKYVQLKRRFLPYAMCMKSAPCKAHLEEVDKRVPIGSTQSCGSPFGVQDLNGNVNEWVSRPKQASPWRSGLKGGWWGPARSRCRPMVTVHDENYIGYEVGFRCCKDAP